MRRRLAALAPLLLLLAACGSDSGYIPRETPPDAPGVPARNPFRTAGTVQTPTTAPQPSGQGAEVAAQPGASGSTSPNLTVVDGGRYVVQRGDTVFGISRKFEVPLRSVIDANDLQPPYTLRVGQAIQVPRQRIHVVEPGNTVYGISRTYGVDLSELVRLNDIAAPYTIAVGQRLVLPTASGTQVASAPQPVAAPEAELDAEEPARSPSAEAPEPASSAPQSQSQPTATRETPSVPVPAAIPTPPARSGGKFAWPLEGKVISAYGPTSDGLHNDGINIEAPSGTPIRAAENGVVAYVGNELRGFGNLLLIKHSDGWVTAYAHTQSFLVKRGDQVTRGQEVARVGRSGSVDRPQLHFEIRKGSRAIDPAEMLGPQQSAR